MNKMKNAKKGELRIIGGKWKGKKIYFDLSKELRPTPDRAKEILFNWLGQDLSGASCLDLFSGTGALGLEALSRGAKKVTFVEKNKEYLERIIKIIKEKEEDNNVNFFCDECLSWMKNYNFPEKFDLVFVDPPFKKNLIHQLLEDIIDKEILSESGRIYFEFEKELDLKIPKPLNLLKIKNMGGKSYVLAEIICPSS